MIFKKHYGERSKDGWDGENKADMCQEIRRQTEEEASWQKWNRWGSSQTTEQEFQRVKWG